MKIAFYVESMLFCQSLGNWAPSPIYLLDRLYGLQKQAIRILFTVAFFIEYKESSNFLSQSFVLLLLHD